MNQAAGLSVTRFLWLIARQFSPYIIGQVIVSIIWAIDLSLGPYLINQMVNKVSLGMSNPEKVTGIWHLAFYYLALSVVMVIVFRFYDWIFLKLNSDLKHHLNTLIINRMLAHSTQFYQNQLMGSITNKLNDVIEHSVNIIRLVVDHFLSHLLAVLIAVFTLWFCLGAQFAIGLIIWVVLFLFVSRQLLIKANKLTHESAEIKSQVMGRISDILNNILSIHIFNKEEVEINKLTTHFDHSSEAMQKRDWCFIKIYFFQKSSFVIFQGVCLWWLITGFSSGRIQAGDFALILIINASIVKCLWSLSRDLREFAESVGTVNAGLSMLYQPLTLDDKKKVNNVTLFKGEIIFENVSFAYENKPILFENISITIKEKERIGIVGYSGSGKSTFMRLILGMHEINKGRILIDGHDISQISKSSLLQAISMIPQNPYLFNRSILENIQFGNEHSTFEDILQVSKMVCMDEFINSLPNKYDTSVGEKGTLLSGGQRQRILIARAILKKTPIFLLDEATNELDMITDNKIQESLRHSMFNTTTLVIAHRLTTLLAMDRILVFNKGRIVQDGKHEVLLQTEGLYKELWMNCNGIFLPN